MREEHAWEGRTEDEGGIEMVSGRCWMRLAALTPVGGAGAQLTVKVGLV